LVDCSAEFLVTDFAVHMSLKDAPQFVVQMEVFDPEMGNRGDERLFPFCPLSLGDGSRGCHHCLILPHWRQGHCTGGFDRRRYGYFSFMSS
jgi:hypothetical protein